MAALDPAVLCDAERCVTEGLFEDAWVILENLPPETTSSMEADRLRLRCCSELEAWKAGIEIASTFATHADPIEREAAAEFFIALANFLNSGGQA
ncbi:hypothetical protein HNR46_002199 [Haloferula luteola]|uniref:Uncharacterized protein n=1 Tax=Haloferula luteola TaxID=595692 RepID=A0A840VDK3_9BACT|nr:hypothetical protein [Haloferula luteola]MBB5351960.1 hypothetical protein [Haloferula luteola]